jgi:Na+/alanine symporter
MNTFFAAFAGFMWGPWLLVLLLGTGFWLTIRLRGIQFRALFYALRLTFSKEREGEGDISHFASLMTIPNLIGLICLSGLLVRETRSYEEGVREGFINKFD